MWGISENFAGMTKAMLHRSRAFVRLAGVEVNLVTYDHRDNYDEIRTSLRTRGDLIDGINILNLWEDLRTWDDAKLKRAIPTFPNSRNNTFEPLNGRGDTSSPYRHTLSDDDGLDRQIDYFRADGSLIVSDRLDAPAPHRRSVTLCDTHGRPIGTWRRMRDLYHFWLDSLPRDPVAWMIADSKTSANHLTSYRRDDVVTMHLVHGSHAGPKRRRQRRRELSKSRQFVFERLDSWDAVVLLTQQQLDDVETMLGPNNNRYVCPNSCAAPAAPPTFVRDDSAAGIMLASLSGRKRIDHAIRAIARSRSRFGRGRATLEVYGEGDRREQLEELIAELDAGDFIRLPGYDNSAPEKFNTASFSLLTSTSEGQPLAVTESMAAGCIPIAYDIAYGPADVITDGVDGFLVKAGDIRSLSRRIKKVASSSPQELAPMREAAFRRSQDFNDEHILKRWGEIMESSALNKRRGSS